MFGERRAMKQHCIKREKGTLSIQKQARKPPFVLLIFGSEQGKKVPRNEKTREEKRKASAEKKKISTTNARAPPPHGRQTFKGSDKKEMSVDSTERGGSRRCGAGRSRKRGKGDRRYFQMKSGKRLGK